jgi:thiol-disulfide isomerase/thioredoxin
MFNKNICLLFAAAFLAACSSCTPTIEGASDTSADNGEEYSFATWEECSQNFGDHPCNFTLQDQYGNDVSLYDFYGDTIVVDFSVMWCAPCMNAAGEVQAIADAYEDEGLTYLTVLMETTSGDPPTTADCQIWSTDYGISEPVLAGSRSMIDYSAVEGWNITGWPTFFFITDEMVLHTALRGYSASYVDMLIQDTMGE